MRTNTLVLVVCLWILLAGFQFHASVGSSSANNGQQFNWKVVVEKSGKANVTVAMTRGDQGTLFLYVPRSLENLQIVPTLNYTLTPYLDSSSSELRIECGNMSQANLSYVWPDAAVQYDGRFYFAGQEKPYVEKGKIFISLPEGCFVSWIEGYEPFSGNTTQELTFIVDSRQLIPSFRYTFPDMPKIPTTSRISEHVTLTFYSVMEGRPWIDKTIEIVESQWDWMKNILEGTINHVNITFAPYGYNDLGTKFEGFCYYNTRNIEIVATKQFGIGDDDWATATLLHELAHALTPLLEAFPSFYCEAIAQDFSYDVLGRTWLNASANECEEIQFTYSYEHGIQKGLFHYVYDWKWGNEIYDNATISGACYGTVTFIGDYFAHRWNYSYYHRLIRVFNSSEIGRLSDAQKLPKFLEYMSYACDCNVTQVLNMMPFLITRWSDAYRLRNEFLNYEIDSRGPFTQSAQGTIDGMIKNATKEYDARNFESAITTFNQIKEYVNNLQDQDTSYWEEQATSWRNLAVLEIVLFTAIILLVIWRYRRLLRETRSRYPF